MFYKTILAFCLLCSSAYCNINVKENYKLYEPIVITCELDNTENTDVIYEWELPDGLVTKPLNKNQCLHAWAGPGEYEVDCSAVIQHKIEIERVIRDPKDPNNRMLFEFEIVSIVARIEVKKFTKTFTVGNPTPDPDPKPEPVPDPEPTPEPTPDPGPEPIPTPVNDPISATGFHVLIVEEAYDRIYPNKIPKSQVVVLSSSQIRSTVQNKYGGSFRQTDDDSPLNLEKSHWADAIAKIKSENKPLPWIIISNDKTWYDGPLPKTMNETLQLIEKYKPR